MFNLLQDSSQKSCKYLLTKTNHYRVANQGSTTVQNDLSHAVRAL